MKARLTAAAMAVLILCAAGYVSAGEKAPRKVIDLVNTKLLALGSDPVIVKAVKEQNAKGMTIEQIKAMDARWTATPGVADFMKAIMDSECGMRIKEIQKTAPYFTEIFVTDNQGANVAMTDKTSDYWQGDEVKFTECYKGGRGAVLVGDIAFDVSTQAYQVQVSVPVKDGETTLGVIVFGINADEVR